MVRTDCNSTHNLKVAGSNPAPATKLDERPVSLGRGAFVVLAASIARAVETSVATLLQSASTIMIALPTEIRSTPITGA